MESHILVVESEYDTIIAFMLKIENYQPNRTEPKCKTVRL